MLGKEPVDWNQPPERKASAAHDLGKLLVKRLAPIHQVEFLVDFLCDSLIIFVLEEILDSGSLLFYVAYLIT